MATNAPSLTRRAAIRILEAAEGEERRPSLVVEGSAVNAEGSGPRRCLLKIFSTCSSKVRVHSSEEVVHSAEASAGRAPLSSSLDREACTCKAEEGGRVSNNVKLEDSKEHLDPCGYRSPHYSFSSSSPSSLSSLPCSVPLLLPTPTLPSNPCPSTLYVALLFSASSPR